MTDDGRRHFLTRSAAAASSLMVPALACDPPPPPKRPKDRPTYDNERQLKAPASAPPADPDVLPDGLNPSNFILYTKTPLTLETKRSKFGLGPITPASHLFVRNNLPLPSAATLEHPDAWQLEIGGVGTPRRFSLPELKRLGIETIAAVLQCSGNGRRFFEHDPSGSPWGVGAAGCVLWTGVPVAKVLAAAGGPVGSAKFLTATGGDPIPTLPQGFPEKAILVQRSIPLPKGLADALLAWELNGSPIPLTHGGPLRLVVPGYYGVNNVKYVRALTCTVEESDAKIQRSSYRVRALGEPGAPSQPTMWRMDVKSWINGPGADGQPVLAGPTVFYGVAFSGERGVRRVEVSIDGGTTWADATFVGPDLGRDAWRTFAFEADLPVGTFRLASRATDRAGDVQPEHRVDNERGYGNNAWSDLAISIEVLATLPKRKPEPAVSRTRPSQTPLVLDDAGRRGRDVFLAHANPACGNCHTLSDAKAGMPLGPNLDELAPSPEKIRNAVTNGVGVMTGYRDQLTPQQLSDLVAYVYQATRRRP